MRYRMISLLSFLCLSINPAGAQTDILTSFIEKNPNAVDFNVLYEGTKLYLAANSEYLLVSLSVNHPALQMRFLMQNASICIDPSGKKRQTFKVKLPSAFDVKDQLEPAPSAQRPSTNAQDERPDIRPLIAALNQHGATLTTNGNNVHLGYQQFHIELDEGNNIINYYMLVPKILLMQDKKMKSKWSIGIISDNDIANMPPPEGGMAGDDNQVMPPPMERNGNESNIQELLRSNIREWTQFYIDDVNNVNITDEEEKIGAAGNSVQIKALERGDSITFIVTAMEIETQLAFLMQGLTIRVDQSDSLILKFPSAPMVRSKVKRHPNEVKAVLESQKKQQLPGHDSINHVVRPDVLPLVSALKDTTALIVYRAVSVETRRFNIDVDRGNAIMMFSIKFPICYLEDSERCLRLSLYSVPTNGDRLEYEGKSLSGENAPRPNGLGDGLRKDNAARRTFHQNFSVNISKNNEK